MQDSATTGSQEHVIVSHQGAALVIKLNKPAQLNALTAQMCSKISAALQPEKLAPVSAVIFNSSSERSFCGGGDVKVIAGNPVKVREFLSAEYEKDYRVASCKLPTIAFMNGITMGGGLGIGVHASCRVADESSVFAMPETRIGAVPDAGVNEFLAKTPAYFGEIVAATSATFGAADAIATGLADYFIPVAAQQQVQQQIAAGGEPETVCENYMADPPPPELLPICERLAAEYAAEVASLSDPAAALAALETLLSREPERLPLLEKLHEVSPVSAAAAIERLRRLRANPQSTREILASDLLVFSRFAVHRNFVEGVRARLIDKDNRPEFVPALSAELIPELVFEMLDARPSAAEQGVITKWLQRL